MILANWVFKHLSGNSDEYCTPPGSEVWKEFGELDEGKPMYLATTYNNDGHELWICFNGGKWLCHFRAPAARQLAKIILWDWWIVSTWCGLKRKIWYWSLRKVNAKQRAAWETAVAERYLRKHGHDPEQIAQEGRAFVEGLRERHRSAQEDTDGE